MQSRESIFTALECAVLELIGRSYPDDQAAIEAQLSTATLRSRENTGAGFFTHFAVDPKSSPAIHGERLRNGPLAQINGMKYGMGFILWLEQGYADCLEGYAFGDDNTTGLDFEIVNFQITKECQAGWGA